MDNNLETLAALSLPDCQWQYTGPLQIHPPILSGQGCTFENNATVADQRFRCCRFISPGLEQDTNGISHSQDSAMAGLFSQCNVF